MATNAVQPAAVPLVEGSPPRIWQRRWFVPAAAAGILLGLGVLAIVLFAFVLWQRQSLAQRKVAAEVSRIQAAGEPVTVEDFYAWHRVPAGTPDVTQTWLEVMAVTGDSFRSAEESAIDDLPIVGQGEESLLRADLPDSNLPAAEAFLTHCTPAIEAAHAAAKLPGECRYPIQFEKAIEALLPHISELRRLARMLSLDVHVKIERGDAAGALESLEAAVAAGESLRHQPTLVEQLVRIAIFGIAIRDTELLLNQATLSDDQLAALSARCAMIDARPGMTTGLLGERGMGYQTFHHVELLSDNGGLLRPSNGRLTRPNDCLLYLEYMNDWIAASREPFPASLKQAHAIDDELKRRVGSATIVDKLNYTVTFLMLPATGVAFEASARLHAQRELLLVAIAAERFRQQTGTWPMQLADLTPTHLPTVPADPYDGKPLRMKIAGDELVLYSVGKNGVEDGGQETERKAEPDIVVRLKAAKGRTAVP